MQTLFYGKVIGLIEEFEQNLKFINSILLHLCLYAQELERSLRHILQRSAREVKTLFATTRERRVPGSTISGRYGEFIDSS